MRKNKKRVVITGMGVISPIGNNINDFWTSLESGKSGIGIIEQESIVKIAGQVKNFNANDVGLSPRDLKMMDKFIQYGLVAANEACAMAKIDTLDEKSLNNMAVIAGSGIGGIETIFERSSYFSSSGSHKMTPFFIPSAIINMLAGHISIKHKIKGPSYSIATACATATHCTAQAYQMIRNSELDIALVGGSESSCIPFCLASFAAARALSNNPDPKKASRPWDKDRDGFVMGAGAGMLVVESLEHAQARGANILAEIVGSGMTSDAFHITQPGDGIKRCIEKTIEDANIDREAIDHINAHATSTPLGDAQEATAIHEIFGKHAPNISLAAVKSMTGHLLGAAGGIELCATILSMNNSKVPPILNLENTDIEYDLGYTLGKSRDQIINYAMKNSFGFGGTNVSIVLANANNI